MALLVCIAACLAVSAVALVSNANASSQGKISVHESQLQSIPTRPHPLLTPQEPQAPPTPLRLVVPQELVELVQDKAATTADRMPQAATTAGQSANATRPGGSKPNLFRLRACNAYVWTAPTIDMYLKKEPQNVVTIPYKDCRNFEVPLAEGDQLVFKSGDADVGTFAIYNLPKAESTLLLIPYRKNLTSTKASFASNVFDNTSSPQVAFIDAFAGAVSFNKIYIQDKDKKESEEELAFNSVVSLNPGEYDISMHYGSNATVSVPVDARANESFVVIRVGASQAGINTWPEDLVVFPRLAEATYNTTADQGSGSGGRKRDFLGHDSGAAVRGCIGVLAVVWHFLMA